MDFIFAGMRFKIGDNQIIWLEGKKFKDVFSYDSEKNIEEQIVERMIELSFLYKKYLVRL